MRTLNDLEAELTRVRSSRPRYQRNPRTARNINEKHRSHLSFLERAAVWVTAKVGTMQFFLIILTWTVLWLGWNVLAPEPLRFDPYPAFVLWLFISNLIQIHLMPLIMVGQNLQGRHAELRADEDFATNKKAELEVQQILDQLAHHAELLDYQANLILQIARRLESDSSNPS
jgi:uncharacterized membrane protein